MLSISLRILLVVGAVLVFAGIASRVKRSRMQMQDSLFWLILGALLVVMSLCPDIAVFFARLFQVQSPTRCLLHFRLLLACRRGFRLLAAREQHEGRKGACT